MIKLTSTSWTSAMQMRSSTNCAMRSPALTGRWNRPRVSICNQRSKRATASRLTLEIIVCEVKEEDTKKPPVVRIDDTCADIDTVLDSQAAARGDASVATDRDGKVNASLHDLPSPLWNHHVFRRVEIIACRER